MTITKAVQSTSYLFCICTTSCLLLLGCLHNVNASTDTEPQRKHINVSFLPLVQNKLTKLQECIHRSICINTSTQAQTPYLHTADKQTPNYTTLHHPRIQIFLSDHIGLPSQYSLPISAFLCSSISAGRSIIGHWGDYSRKPITAPGWI